MVFDYPQQVHLRRHGPEGYSNYQSYKPWLRDEFDFRCIYCLWRERWCASGDAAFSVDHLTSRSVAPHLICVYENLVYTCCRCNAARGDVGVILDPCRDIFADHLQVAIDGTIHGMTQQGRDMISVCKLASPQLTESRRRMLDLIRLLTKSDHPKASELLHRYLTIPDNPPVLAKCRPPGGNTRPDGIRSSYYERLRRGEPTQ
jgi:hypothetical protein